MARALVVFTLFVAACSSPSLRQREQRVARAQRPTPAAPTWSAVDAAFASTILPTLLAQIHEHRWADFVPSGGTLVRVGLIHSMGDEDNDTPKAERLCTPRALREQMASKLEELGHDLEAADRSENDGGFTCEDGVCSMAMGEAGYNGALRFVREGRTVRLVSVARWCGGGHSPEQQTEMDQAFAALPNPRCARR